LNQEIDNPEMPAVVALTGASGFIGRAILQKLVKRGYKVRALVRKPQPDTESVQWIQGDLSNTAALQELVKDVFAIIHCAGQVRGNSLETFVQTNVEGTKNLVCAATDQTAKPRFLLISSLAARQPELSWYAKSKQMAEQTLAEDAGNMQWTAFRPTAVYGPGDKEIKPIFNATRHGFLPVVGKPTNYFSLLHVKDFVSAIQCWLELNVSTNGIFELDDGKPGGYSYQSLATIAQEVWQRPVRCFSIPLTLVRLVANTNLWLSRLLHYAPMLTPGKVRELQHPNWLCDNKPLMHALPCWHPSVNLRDALPQISGNK
jgi:nucleoside-diphosphate-sugar epimerase